MATTPSRSVPADTADICVPERHQEPAIRAYLGWQRFLAFMDRRLDAALRDAGLTRNQLVVLATVANDEGLTQQDLAERLGLTKASMSQMLTRLESAGLIQRVPEARAYALQLTPRSRDLLARALPDHHARIVAHFAALDPAEQRLLESLTAKLGQTIDDVALPCDSGGGLPICSNPDHRFP